jgi:hypothetical protein
MIKRLFIIILLIFALSVQVFAGSQQISATDASVIAQRARYYLNDPTTWGGTQKHIWSDAELLQWINDGTNDIVARTQCLEDIETVTLVANTSSYALTTTAIAIKGAIYNAGTGSSWSLERGNYKGRYMVNALGMTEAMTGPPQYWVQEENSIWIYPIPTATEATKTIDVIVILRPTVVGATDDVKVPAFYDRALTLYVVIQALYKDGQFNKAATITAQYLSELDRYRADYVEPMPKVQQ